MNDSHHASLEPQHCNQDTLTAGDRSSDTLLRRLRDQEVALHISERIAAIRDKKKLLRLIVQEIQPIFDFHDCGLFIVSRDGQTHQDLAAVMPEISPSETNYLLSEQAPPVVPHPGSLLEWMMAQIDQVGRPVLMDFRDLWEQDPGYPQFQIMRDWPFRDCLATNLRIGGQTFGLFCINATQKNHFKPQQFPLFQQIANQIAIAIANILANEELEQRAADLETSNAELRRHDALLLSITEATQCLLENDDLDIAIPQALKILGEGTQQDRVYIFENTVDEATGEILWVIPYEWNAPGIPADTASNYFPLPMSAFPSHLIDPIKNGQVVQFLRRDLDGIALELNEHGQAKSLVGVPITIKGQWWGVIGFDDCHTEKHWSESEIAVLKIAASSIGSAIERDRTRKAREDAERAVLLEREKAAQERAANLEERTQLLEARDCILESTASAAIALLSNRDFDTAVETALQILGEGLDTDRICVLEHIDDLSGQSLGYMQGLYEWHSSYTESQIAHPELSRVSYDGIEDWYYLHLEGQWTGGLIDDTPEPFRSTQKKLGVKAVYGVPVTVDGKYWGVIGFDDCRTTVPRGDAELAILKTAAACIGSAIERDRTRKAREDAERRILLEREQATRDRADYLEETNRILSLREQWLDATANAANALLSEPDLDTAINTAMRIIGETTGADRMGVMTFTPDPTGRSLGVFHETYEWDSPYATSQKDHPTLHAIPTDGLEDIVMQMMAGEWTGGLIDEFDEPFRSGQIELGVKSTYAVPIFVRDTLWGIVAIDHCREARRLTPAELAVFKTAASCVGSAIQQVQNRAAREEAERRILLEREQAAQEKAAHLEETNRILSLREQWLEAAANAANALLSESDLDAAIDNALRVIGESIDIDRVAVMRQIDDPTGETFGSIRMMHEWNSAYASPQILHPDLHEISWAGVEDWFVRQAQGDWLGGVVTELREPIRSGQIKLGVQSTYSVPIFVGDRFWGMLCIDHCREPKRLTTAEIAVLKTAATCIGSAIHQEQIRQSREAAEKAVLNERNRMARDIHDTLAQSFTGIIMQLEAARNALPASSEETQERLQCASDIARHGLAEARQSVHALRSSALESCNLPTALQRLVRQMTEGTSVQVTVETEGQSYPLPAEVEDNLLRIGQEALTNALRHANPSQICIRLLYEEKMLHLSVSDNGRGFDPQESLYQSGFGIVGMQERSHLINGEFHLNSQPNAGTTITVSVRTR